MKRIIVYRNKPGDWRVIVHKGSKHLKEMYISPLDRQGLRVKYYTDIKNHCICI